MISKLLAFLSFFLLTLGALVPATAQQWIEHRPQDTGYRVEFPGAPTIETEDRHNKAGRPYKLTMASYQPSRNVVYMVVHVVLPTSLDADPQVELDRARDGSAQNSKGTILAETRLSIGGMPARRIVMDIEQGRSVGLIVLGGNRLYHVVALVPAGWEEGPDVKRFLNSFALLSP